MFSSIHFDRVLCSQMSGVGRCGPLVRYVHYNVSTIEPKNLYIIVPEVALRHNGDLKQFDVSEVRLTCASLPHIVKESDSKSYQKALEIVEFIYSRCPAAVPFQLYTKLTFGLKKMVCTWYIFLPLQIQWGILVSSQSVFSSFCLSVCLLFHSGFQIEILIWFSLIVYSDCIWSYNSYHTFDWVLPPDCVYRSYFQGCFSAVYWDILLKLGCVFDSYRLNLSLVRANFRLTDLRNYKTPLCQKNFS